MHVYTYSKEVFILTFTEFTPHPPSSQAQTFLRLFIRLQKQLTYLLNSPFLGVMVNSLYFFRLICNQAHRLWKEIEFGFVGMLWGSE